MNRVRQPRPLVVPGPNVWMGTAAGADELVDIPTDAPIQDQDDRKGARCSVEGERCVVSSRSCFQRSEVNEEEEGLG
jgi:hypothetical protein